MVEFNVRTHDCSHEFSNGLKTCVQLFFKGFSKDELCLTYGYTSETQEEVELRKDFYIDSLVKRMKENIEWRGAM